MAKASEGIAFGERLLRAGLITREQLERALKLQKDIGGKLGKILLKMGFVSEPSLLEHLAKHLEVELVALKGNKVPSKLLTMLPVRTMREKKIIPLSLKEGVLTVAMGDPSDCDTIEEVRFETGQNVKAVLTSEKEIDEMLAGLGSEQPLSGPESAAKQEAGEKEAAASAEGAESQSQQVLAHPTLETLMRLPPRIKVDALIEVLLQGGIISKEALEQAMRDRARD
jgi:type IV pilus assembly protein PilB